MYSEQRVTSARPTGGRATLLQLRPKLRRLTLHMARGVTDECVPVLVNLTHLELHNAVQLTDQGLR